MPGYGGRMPQRLPVPVPSPDPPTTPFVAVATVGWALASGALRLAGAPAEWQRIAILGALIGLPLLTVVLLRDRRRARRHG